MREKLAEDSDEGNEELLLHGGSHSQNSRRAVTAKGTPERPIIVRRFSAPRFPGLASLLQLVHVVEHASRDANHEHLQVAPRLMLQAAWHIHDDAFVEFDFSIVEAHLSRTIEHVINFVRALMIVQ